MVLFYDATHFWIASKSLMTVVIYLSDLEIGCDSKKSKSCSGAVHRSERSDPVKKYSVSLINPSPS